MMPAGRPTKYQDSFAEIARRLAKLSHTEAEIADFFEVTEKTIANWKNEYPEFLHALKAGKEDPDRKVEKSLFQRAIGYEHDDTDIRVVKGKIVKTKVIKHYPPDPTSMIFWLKNRKKAEWRDKVDHTLSGPEGGPVEVIERRIIDPENKA